MKLGSPLVALLSVSLAIPAVHGQIAANWPEAPASIFKIVKTPDPNGRGFQNGLSAISGSSSSDIWAVGQSVIHFDGTKWTAFSAPDINGGGINQLQSVAEVSPRDVWAVGHINLDELNPNQLIEHYNGTAWSIFPGPQFQPTDVPTLESVTAITADDIWAAGSILTDDTQLLIPLFEHYDGNSWTAFETVWPNAFMYGVSADSNNDVWAVGSIEVNLTAAEHYDGNVWSIVSSPSPGFGENVLFAVAALAPKDAWAVGFFTQELNSDRPRKTLIEHWNGSSWQMVSSPNPAPATHSNVLYGITAVSANDIWAFGSSLDIASDLQKTLVLHWNGTSWTIVPSPNVANASPNTDFLAGGTVLPAGDLWLVGGYGFLQSLALNATGQ